MASVTVQKHTATGCAAQLRHDKRECKNYGNEDINRGKSSKNVHLDPYRSAQEAHTALKRRVADIDRIKPPQRRKKDRIVCVGYCVPAPRANMSYEDSVRFLTAAYNALKEKYGENIISGDIHADEVHTYRDSRTKQLTESRVHLHVLAVPEHPEKGVNAKCFVTRSLYPELNQLMDEVCMREFGYAFQDGTRQQSRGTVEDLKREEMSALDKEIKQLRTRVDSLRQTEQTKIRSIAEHDELLLTTDRVVRELTGKRDSMLQELEEARKKTENERQRTKLLEEQNRGILGQIRANERLFAEQERLKKEKDQRELKKAWEEIFGVDYED